MRLSGIKLAGFKSFVDPTSLPLPSRLTSVVGPNGCGKSNLIDAVRWVLGEASIKNLRGADSEDVTAGFERFANLFHAAGRGPLADEYFSRASNLRDRHAHALFV